MAINYAPPPAQNNNAIAMALLAQQQGSSGGGDVEMALRKMMLERYLGSVGDASPVQHPMQAVARAVNGGIAGYQLRQMLADAKAQEASTANTLVNLPGLGGGASPMPQPAPQAAPGPMGALSGMGASIAAALAGGGDAPAPGRIPFKNTPEMSGIVKMPPEMPQQPQGGPPPIDGGTQALVKQLMGPSPVAEQPTQLTGGNPSQGIDASRIAQEVQKNPALVKRWADMVNGETNYRDPKLATIQAETARNRALARNIPMDQALLSVSDDRRKGYYASDTYSRPAGPQQMAMFEKEILPKVLGGSEVGRETLGFNPTGNASQLGFAQRRANQGMYDNYKWYSGQPGKGEMYAVEKGDQARMAKNVRSNFPRELMSPQADAGLSFAPTQVASDDPSIGLPRDPQSPPVGSFQQGSLPNVRNVNVRPTGYNAAPVAPQAQQPQQMAQAQQGSRQTVQIPPEMAAQIRTLIANPKTRAYGMQLYQQYAKPVERYEPINGPDGKPVGQKNSLTGKVEPYPRADTDDLRELDAENRSRAQRGQPPLSPMDFITAVKKSGAMTNSVVIDQKAETAFSSKAAEAQVKRYNEILETGFNAKAMRSDLDTLRDLRTRFETGKAAEIKSALGPYAEALGVDVKNLGDIQAYDAIIAKLAPRMRPAGSGATSDFEMQQYLKALPTLGKTPEGNAILDGTMQALQQHQERAAEIASKALNGEIDRKQAEKELRELPDPMTAWKQWRKSQSASENAPVRRYNPATGKIE